MDDFTKGTYKTVDWLAKEIEQKGREAGYAGFWVRFLAQMIDGFIIYILNYICIMMFPSVFAFLLELTSSSFSPDSKLGIVVSFFAASFVVVQLMLLISIFYYTVFNCSRMQGTPGKWIMRIHITDQHGFRINFLRSFLRFCFSLLSYSIFFIGFLFIPFTKERTALHDIICGTRVMPGRPKYYPKAIDQKITRKKEQVF